MAEPLPRRDGTLHPTGSPRYGSPTEPRRPGDLQAGLLSGGLLTMVMGVGFDEAGANRSVDDEVEQGLLQRGFRRNDEGALLLLRQAGRPDPQPGADHFLCQRGQGAQRDVDVVISLVRARDGSAGDIAAAAFLDGMDRCEVAIYGGHGRYGTGPDFDFNFTADLLDEHGTVLASFRDYKDLEEELSQQARKTGRTLFSHYEQLLQNGLLEIKRQNSGNLVINLRNYHQGEFGACVMVDQLKEDKSLLRLSQRAFAPKYRLWLFQACRSSDFFYNLRELNPQINAGGLDLFGTRRLVYWEDHSKSMLCFLDGVLRQASHKELLDGLGAANPEESKAADDSEVPQGGSEGGPSHVVDPSSR